MDLIDKIRKVEALLVGAKSEGERQAAELAIQRLQGRLEAQPIEYTVHQSNLWMKSLFIAICQKYKIKTYRYTRQKFTTTMVRVSKPFMDEILWPEFNKYSRMFQELADEIMEDLTSKIHVVKEEDEVVVGGELASSTKAVTL